MAYGLDVRGLPDDAPLLTGPAGAPLLEIAQAPLTDAVANRVVIDGRRHRAPLRGGGDLELDGATALFRLPAPATGEELVHPHLAAAAAGRMRLLGHEVLHAGAVLAGGRAWAVAGDRGSGKSTLLAAFAAAGVPVLADDLLVLADGIVHAGPRCLDLRDGRVPEGLPPGTLVRSGTRHRVGLAPSPASAPLAGVVFLAWADRQEIVRVPPGERLDRIAHLRRWPFVAADPRAALDLVALPAVEIRRPRDPNLIAATATILLERLGRSARR